MRITLLVCLLATLAPAYAAPGREPLNFLFADSDSLAPHARTLERADIAGVQIVYTWKSLEPAPDEYDFSQIETDLRFLSQRGKKLFVQVQDRFFLPTARNVPRYLLERPEYGGGLAPQADNPGEGQPEGHGWVAMQWNAAVRARFQALLRALARRFDGRVYGINLPESSADIDRENDRTGFDCDAYFAAEMENARVARQAFRESRVVQYVNFWPCEWNDDRRYMSRFFEFAARQRLGLGGPDIVPWQRAQMNNSYPFFNRYRGRLDVVAMAVQEPTLTYTNPKTQRKFTRAEFVEFARDYLGVDIIFWSLASPWLADAPN
ncbi:MAG TPA: hypothetical protein VMF52_21140 [Steroidobacteraceae bacterium]|nr:hypothetical protein [Steroidobacteraceae bacterium]